MKHVLKKQKQLKTFLECVYAGRAFQYLRLRTWIINIRIVNLLQEYNSIYSYSDWSHSSWDAARTHHGKGLLFSNSV